MADPRVARRGRRDIPDDPEEFRATLVEHLDELRGRIIRVLVLLIVSWIVMWQVQPAAYNFLNTMVNANVRGNGRIINEAWTNATDAFMFKLRLSFLMAVIVAFPFAILELWGFIKPGLKVNERKAVNSIAPWTVVLFALGVGFAWLVVPQAIHWFVSYIDDFPGTILNQEPGKMVFFVLKMLLAFGIAFQLPLVVFMLGKLGILTPEFLLKYWRQATTGIFIFAMIITPSNDPGSMLMMAIPLSLLFMASVYLVKWTVKPKAPALAGGVRDELDSNAD